MRVDRASTNDLVMLATESGGQVPNFVGAVLLLAGGPTFDLDDAQRVIAERVRRIPRLRQRLDRVPVGCGRPIWVDDPHFDIDTHLRRERCPAPGDEQALLALAADICGQDLPRSRPRWTSVLVSGLAGDRAALILVLHHVLADGIGGLAVLAGVMDGPGSGAVPAAAADHAPGETTDHSTVPRSVLRPTAAELANDAMRSRWRAVRALPAAMRQLPGSFRSAGGPHPPAAADCSLLRPTGPRRQVAVARADLAALRAVASANGATVNDALLGAVTGALHALLAHRGENLETIRITVPVAGRQPRSTGELGNDVSVLVVGLPVTGEPAERLRVISHRVRAAREISAGPSPAALVGPLFRAAAAMGFYRWYLRRQRRFHTIVSNVRGPARMLSLAGSEVESIIPLAVEDLGNVTVMFVALSYAGTLTVAAIADPDQLPDLPILMAALQAELDAGSGVQLSPGRVPTAI